MDGSDSSHSVERDNQSIQPSATSYTSSTETPSLLAPPASAAVSKETIPTFNRKRKMDEVDLSENHPSAESSSLPSPNAHIKPKKSKHQTSSHSSSHRHQTARSDSSVVEVVISPNGFRYLKPYECECRFNVKKR